MATLPAAPLTIRDRFDALTPRERRMLALLGVALLLFALYLLLRGSGESGEVPVELAAAPPPPVAAPAPTAYTPPPPPPPAPVTAPPAQTGTLLLVGIFGGGPGGGAAILQGADGAQRLVRVGREFQPGTSLRAVGLRHVVIATPGGDLRLEIGKAGGTPVVAPVPALAASAPQPAPAAGAPATEAVRRETLQYQLGTERVQIGGQSGYRIKPGQRLPHLDKAGLQPGDVIVGINGGGFNEERLMEMAYDINNAPRTEFEVIRNGRRLRMALER
jgi:type II secretory pathway component PulC